MEDQWNDEGLEMFGPYCSMIESKRVKFATRMRCTYKYETNKVTSCILDLLYYEHTRTSFRCLPSSGCADNSIPCFESIFVNGAIHFTDT